MANKPSIPKGTRDFSPEEVQKRDYIFNTIRDVFKRYGYQPLETPAMENLTTLLGKYGDEGDKLIFRILNSGDYLAGIPDEDLKAAGAGKLSSLICEKGLRYDLTVPFARYVVQHREEIIFPFRRYQIQPVWRADRPQKGRYREFFQCDADVIGSNSLVNEYELVRIIDDIFSNLKIRITVKLNNRKILAGISEYIGESARLTDITVAIDKLDKIGLEAVNSELAGKCVSESAIGKLQPILSLEGSTEVKLGKLDEILALSETGKKGISELRTLFSYFTNNKPSCQIELDLTLARGLNYYTGAIIEVKAADVSIGSICGGGRYDDLTGIFGLSGVSGVGVSFGADRIYDVMEQLGLFVDTASRSTDVLVLNFGETELQYAISVAGLLRNSGYKVEIYPDQVKLKKQMAYADARKIPVIVIAGADEVKNDEVTVKIMTTGEQQKIRKEDLPVFLQKFNYL